MPAHAIKLDIPETVYEQIRRAAAKVQRPIDDLLIEAVSAVAPVADSVPPQMRSALAHMAYLNDAALWQAARSTMASEQRERLEDLHHKQQRESLTAEEQAEEQNLLTLFREAILIRAQAAVLLKHRGYDASDPKQFAPLE